MSASPIPKTAPFADDEIDSLNRVVGTATPIQRAWLAGFLAGLDAQQVGDAAGPIAPAAAPLKAEPLTVLYATESGNSEKLAGDVAKSARKLGFKPTLVDMADLDVASLQDAKRLIVIAATWGGGGSRPAAPRTPTRR
jgi:sulfite reductase (NADPH) flavoprotein alpha-component